MSATAGALVEAAIHKSAEEHPAQHLVELFSRNLFYCPRFVELFAELFPGPTRIPGKQLFARNLGK